MIEAGLDCIAIQSLGHDTALGRSVGRAAGRVGARRQVWGRAGKRWGSQVGAQGTGVGGRQVQACRRARAARRAGVGAAGTQAGARQVWERGALGVSARGARCGSAAWACLCAWWACWLGQLG